MRERPDRIVARLLLAALLAATGSAAVVRGQAPRGKVTEIRTGDRRDLRDWDARLLRMERSREVRLRSSEQDTLLTSRQHDRFDQYYRGVRVFGGDLVRESAGQLTVRIAGNLYTGIDIDATPALTSEQAVTIAERLAGGSRLDTIQPELVVLPRDDGAYALTWRVVVWNGRGLPVMFVDARTGAEVLRYDNLKTQSATIAVGRGRGVLGDEKKMSVALSNGRYVAMELQRPWPIWTFDMKGNFSRTQTVLDTLPLGESDRATDLDNEWDDAVVVDAHTYAGWTLDYLYKRFNRNGIGGASRAPALEVIVHPVRRADIETLPWEDAGEFFLNAFYCGRCAAGGYDLIMLGEGLPPGYFEVSGGQYVDYFAASLDIVAHELAHGVTDYSSDLVYRNESGALSEAFSDIIGMGAEAYLQPAGPGPWTSDYLIGEDTFRPSRPGSTAGMRSAANPGIFGDPDHYSKRFTGTDDGGGVHINSTIVSHAFYLAVEGGTNRTSGLAVQGVGASNREQIERAFYRAFTTGIPSNATFSQAREATIQSARELYGAGGAVERAVTQAWTAVGVN